MVIFVAIGYLGVLLESWEQGRSRDTIHDHIASTNDHLIDRFLKNTVIKRSCGHI